jgi:DNA-directed RNA polymerase specialized sigma24 family protein
MRNNTNYWLVLKGSKPVDLVRSTNSHTSVVETELLLKHKRFVASDYFPMQEDKFDYQALTYDQFSKLCRPSELAKFKTAQRYADRGNRHEEDKRAVVLESYEAGRSVVNIALDFGVSRATIYRWVQESDYERCIAKS